MTIAEQMRREGRAEGRAATLAKQIQLKFGDVNAEIAQRIGAATPAELDRWVERILTASSLDDLFAE